MRAIQIVELSGPESLQLADIDEPTGEGVVVDVRAAGVSFPEVLQTRGLYQIKPELPFVPGSEVAGVVRADAHGFKAGDRVAAFCMLGGFAETVVAPAHFTFRLPDALDFAQGAGLVLNYHTAYFSLVDRGRLQAGETVLVHGAAGGVGTASIQVAKGLGARVLAVVSSDEKEAVARAAGADEVLRSDGDWKDAGEGARRRRRRDRPGRRRPLHRQPALLEHGRPAAWSSASPRGAIPEVKVNRLLLNNLDVVGAGWGAYITKRPEVIAETAQALDALIESGHIRPIVGARFPFEEAARALELIDGRGATGKVVLEP